MMKERKDSKGWEEHTYWEVLQGGEPMYGDPRPIEVGSGKRAESAL